jgi:opacity protein-like surface antigen
VGVSGGVLRTTLLFNSGTSQQQLQEGSLVATLSYRPSRFSFQFGVGPVTGGTLEGDLGSYTLGVGILGTASASWLVLDGQTDSPLLVSASLTLGAATAPTQNVSVPTDRPTFTALDIRLSAIVGHRFFGFWTPYLGAGVFGGRVYFAPLGQSLVGTDQHHYRISVGSNFELPAHLSVFAELGFLGEQNLIGGASYSF